MLATVASAVISGKARGLKLASLMLDKLLLVQAFLVDHPGATGAPQVAGSLSSLIGWLMKEWFLHYARWYSERTGMSVPFVFFGTTNGKLVVRHVVQTPVQMPGEPDEAFVNRYRAWAESQPGPILLPIP